MAQERPKKKAPGKLVKVKIGTQSLMARGTEALVPSRGPGSFATEKVVKKLITFTLSAPEATRVFVAGSFNGWNPAATPLEPDTKGLWSLTMTLGPGRHEYRFVVDDVWWSDPANLLRRPNEFGTENAIVVVD
jgi:1,4-alpha-glucan branching enzyme